MPTARDGAADAGVRQVRFGAVRDENVSRGFPSNAIKTSKYTKLNFLPKNIWEQLHKAANAYFLAISFIMFLGNHTPLFSGTINFAATFSTLVIMMAFSAVIAALDDRQRKRADRQANSQVARRISLTGPDGLRKERVEWQDIAVGDILIIKGGEDLPADLVPLACPSDEGECHVSTANLDGESNLKVRCAVPCTQELLCDGDDLLGAEVVGLDSPPSSLPAPRAIDPMHLQTAEQEPEDVAAAPQPAQTPHRDPLLVQVLHRLSRVEGVISAEAPQRSIHNFNGAALVVGSSGEAKEEALGPSHLLLRGTQLRNIAWCVGVVVYTGRHTRMVMNSTKAPSKYANLEKTINKAMVVVVTAQAMLALISACVYMKWSDSYNSYWYIVPGGKVPHLLPDSISSWLTFFVLYSNLMPISLYATMEVCNFAQASFIRNDLEMYDEEQDVAASARATNLGHELGQVSYVFSDKTGTLTQNVMELKRISVADQVYGKTGGGVGFTGGAEVAEAKRRDPRQAERIDDFLEVLAVSHTVVAVPTGEPSSAQASSSSSSAASSCKVRYEAESPDEAALVEAAAGLGWTFMGRRGGRAELVLSAGPKEYEVLALNAFNSSRKRQSVIVRKQEGEVLLLCKGADNIMLQRAATSPAKIKEQLTEFAKEGLRTLVLGRRTLTENEFRPWFEEYQKAQSLLSGRAEALEEVAEKVERSMDIMGITAIEDKLQVGVQETIVSVREAGIKLWVLTGDKLETAQNIGFSTKVLTDGMKILVLDAERGEAARAGLGPRLASKGAEAASALSANGVAALLVTGQALEEISAAGLDADFLNALAMKCSVVIACRVSPSQKAQLVKLVRDTVKPTPVTLAIGDGANDVPMIQAAQVGVGIAGREGRQAANSADFSVAQFRYLQRLLLVHGRWNYRRACKFTLYSFWKNAVMVLLMFYYTFAAGYSGTSLFEDLVRASYNVVLSWPIIATGVFDRDVSAQDALRHPELYETGREGMDLNPSKILETLLSALVHSGAILCVLSLAYTEFSFAGTGDYYTFGTAVFTWLIIAMNYRVAFLTTTWNWISLAAQAASFLSYVVFLILYCLIRFDPNMFDAWMYWVPVRMAGTPMFWFCAIAVPALAIVIDIFKAYLVLQFRPDRRDLILEQAGAGQLEMQHQASAFSMRQASPAAALTSAVSSFDFDHPEGPPGRPSSFGYDHGRSRPSLNRAATDTTFVDDMAHGACRARSPRPDLEGEVEEGLPERVNRPLDGPLAQQTLRSWQFVLTGRKVLVATLSIGALLLVMFLLMWSARLQEAELWVQYDGKGATATCPAAAAGAAAAPCDVTITLSEDFRPPVSLFYSVDPFNQNIPAYLLSGVTEQLFGRWGSPQSIDKRCPAGTRTDAEGRQIFPCGLRATSVFNDTFEVLPSPSGSPLPLDRSGIAWKKDLERYKNPESYPGRPGVSWLYMRYPNSVVSKDEGVRSEAFAVWMRPQAMPMVLNPYGHLDEGLTAGQNLTIRINASFPVRSIGARKYIVLRTSAYLGVASSEFGLFCLSTGIICWACSAVVVAIGLLCPRRPGEPRHFRFCKLWGSKSGGRSISQRWCWESAPAGDTQSTLPAPSTVGPSRGEP